MADFERIARAFRATERVLLFIGRMVLIVVVGSMAGLVVAWYLGESGPLPGWLVLPLAICAGLAAATKLHDWLAAKHVTVIKVVCADQSEANNV